MIPYEFLPHEYIYALFLSYEYDLWPSHPMILNKMGSYIADHKMDLKTMNSQNFEKCLRKIIREKWKIDLKLL